MRTVLLLFLAGLLLSLASAATAQQPTLKPVASLNQLMKAIIIPTSDAVFQVAAEAPNGRSVRLKRLGPCIARRFLAQRGSRYRRGSRQSGSIRACSIELSAAILDRQDRVLHERCLRREA